MWLALFLRKEILISESSDFYKTVLQKLLVGT